MIRGSTPSLLDVWSENHPFRGMWIGRSLLKTGQVVALSWRDFWEDECIVHATALAYTSILSIVPLMALAFSLSLAFPGLLVARQELQAILFSYLSVGADQQIIQALRAFVRTIHSGALAGIGTVSLMVTSILVLNSIESSLNRIWAVKKGRSIQARVVYYLLAVIAGPMVLAVLLRTVAVSALAGLDALQLAGSLDIGLIRLTIVPFFVAWGACTALYVLMPNTRVRFSGALAGGFAAGLMLHGTNWAYRIYASHPTMYRSIYGAVSAIPVFLVWIYVLWVIILLGAEIAYSVEHIETHRRKMIHRNLSQSSIERIAALISIEAARRFARGIPGQKEEEICERFSLPPGIGSDLMESLSKHHVLTLSERGYVPARDPAALSLDQVVCAMRTNPPDTPGPDPNGWVDAEYGVCERLEAVRDESVRVYASVTLAELAAGEDDDGSAAKV